MQLIFIEQHTIQTMGKPSVTELAAAPLRFDGPRLMVVEPVSWAFLATLFVASFAKGLGEGLGSKIGEGLLRAFGLLRDEHGPLRDYLDSLAARIERSVQQTVYQNEIRRENANLEQAIEELERYLINPSARLHTLQTIEWAAGNTFRQFRSLGLGALTGLVTAGGLRIAVAAERYRLAPKKDRGDYQKEVEFTITQVRGEVQRKLDDMKSYYDSRVRGPYPTDVTEICLVPVPGVDFPVSVGAFPLKAQGNSRARSGSGSPQPVTGPGVGWIIDGQEYSLPFWDCYSSDRHSENQGRAETAVREAKLSFSQEFASLYQDKYSSLDAAILSLEESMVVESEPKSH